jgi:hypothetical protein
LEQRLPEVKPQPRKVQPNRPPPKRLLVSSFLMDMLKNMIQQELKSPSR